MFFLHFCLMTEVSGAGIRTSTNRSGSATMDRALNVVVAVRMAGAGDDESWLYGDDSKGEEATDQTGHPTFIPCLKSDR